MLGHDCKEYSLEVSQNLYLLCSLFPVLDELDGSEVEDMFFLNVKPHFFSSLHTTIPSNGLESQHSKPFAYSLVSVAMPFAYSVFGM